MKLTLAKKKLEAKGAKSFFWKPEKPVKHGAGQYFYITLPKLNYSDSRGATRLFTIASSPNEELLQITTRIRQSSGFKKTLDELEIGAKVEGEGPNGTFVLDFNHPMSNTHIFLAGGIGITPFRGMIKYNIDKNLKIPMYLIYSNSGDGFVYAKELKKWQKENDFIKVEFFNSSKLGHLDKERIENFLKHCNLSIKNCTFWVVGPPAFVNAMETALGNINIGFGQVKTEKFTGY